MAQKRNPPDSNPDSFSIWKNRMIAFMNFPDRNLLKTITEGHHIPPLIIPPGTSQHVASNARIKWNDENKYELDLDSKAKHFLIVSLPDEIYRLVMYCDSAKEMWDNLIALYEGTDETRECCRSLLIDEYKLFEYKPGESLTKTYIRFVCLINDLKQLKKTYDNEDRLIKFLTSLPPALSTMAMTIRQSKNLETMSLQSLYGTLLAYEELNAKRDKSYKGVEVWSGTSSDNEDCKELPDENKKKEEVRTEELEVND